MSKKNSQRASERAAEEAHAEAGAEPRELEAPRARDLEVERLIEERDEAIANWRRAQADYQNLRRRLQSDSDAAVQRSKQALLDDLLLVADYLEMALATPTTTAEGKNLLAGVELTRSALLRALDRADVRPLAEEGNFDPAVHQAVESVVTDDPPAGTILATLRRGYTIGDQVIRPAQVRVAVAPGSEGIGGATARAALEPPGASDEER